MKKIYCTLLMLICMFSLTACNGEKEMLKYNEVAVQFDSAFLFDSITTFANDEEVYNTLTEANVYQLNNVSNYLYKDAHDKSGQIGISEYPEFRMSGETFRSAVDSYVKATDEMGDISSAGNMAVIVAKEDELIVTYDLVGSKHPGSMEVIYDKNLTITSVTINVDYSVEELMAKAGVNTAIGMGTVFIMLIVIMIIIMILGLVPKIFEKKPAKEEAKKDGVDKAIEGIVAREEAEEEDDLELVAVIAAAIASYEGTSTDGFVVRSIKRIK